MSIFNAENQDHINVLLTRLDLHTGKRVLDAACGTGEITCQMATKYPGVQIIGIDCSDEQIKIEKRKCRE